MADQSDDLRAPVSADVMIRVLDGIELVASTGTPDEQYENARAMLIGLDPDDMLVAATVATRLAARALMRTHQADADPRRGAPSMQDLLELWRSEVLLREIDS